MHENRMIGRSDAIRAIEKDVECAARTDAKVLITGETGVGKEVVARLIHERGSRRGSSLVTVNCAGLPDSLLESELFGHLRGSFTGAYRDKPGLLEMAPNGTVFLDEVGEMSVRMQVMMLRFLETGEIQRVGADCPHTRVNVRIITATNRDLTTMISTGAFRDDLYFRLKVIQVLIPPLRDRVEDIPLLVEHYLAYYCHEHGPPVRQISAAAMDVLMAYRWPGNIRELKNVVERIALGANGQIVRPEDLPDELCLPASLRITEVVDINGGRRGGSSPAMELTARMLLHGESFWLVVYPLFVSHDLTREDLRKVVQIGLETTNGSYRILIKLFNMPDEDYRRFLTFLRKHDCHLPFQRFRVAPARLSLDTSRRVMAS
jgi:transcriptional regulator with GAF, ATPase, and Fis domain